ncbi:MAG: DUF177 domain-containing protein [Lachnospiraceae bacterium]|jgi:uncharacterized protein|nr:DUF177 domain-containing protein [Lachnospiraceae bacterium]
MINVSNVLSGAGTVKKTLPISFDSVKVFGKDYPVTSKSDIDLTLDRLSKEEIQVSFTASVEVTIPCDRCLTDVIKQFDLTFDDKLSFQEVEENEDVKSGYVVGYNLDVDKLVYDEILVNWPDKVLCSEDCKGVCGSCGKNLNLGTCDCQDTGLDLRMAVIQDIFKEFKEV